MTGMPLRYNLMMNGYVGLNMRPLMGTVEGVSGFLKLAADWADMEVVTTQTINLDSTNEEWYGLSGLSMIKTSHIAIHLWPFYDTYYFFDISSCKPFDPEALMSQIEEYFEEKCEWKSFINHIPKVLGP